MKGDDSLKSFVFTLKNPHNMLVRRFALMAKEKQWEFPVNGKDRANDNLKSFFVVLKTARMTI
jgi:hypothetical protein